MTLQEKIDKIIDDIGGNSSKAIELKDWLRTEALPNLVKESLKEVELEEIEQPKRGTKAFISFNFEDAEGFNRAVSDQKQKHKEYLSDQVCKRL